MTVPSLSPMQDYALTVDRFLDHGAKWHAGARVITAGRDEDAAVGYAVLRDRANRLSGALQAVGLVAVIGRPDPKWGERPLMVIEPVQGSDIDDGTLKASLKGRVADWWIPDRIVRVEAMPLAATGKINKTQLRATYGGA